MLVTKKSAPFEQYVQVLYNEYEADRKRTATSAAASQEKAAEALEELRKTQAKTRCEVARKRAAETLKAKQAKQVFKVT